MKEKGTSYLLWAGWLIGLGGLHRLYNGKIGTGLLYLFTWGLVGIGQIIDLFTIPGMVRDANNRRLLDRLDPAALLAAQDAGRRAPRTPEEFQVALARAAEHNGGRLTVAEGVAHTGRGFKDVQRHLDELAAHGFVELDSDDRGQLYYGFPGMGEPKGQRPKS